MNPVGIRSLAVKFPSTIRTNDYFRSTHPDVVKAAEEKSVQHVYIAADAPVSDHPFDIEMRPFLRDPFIGAVERRWLGPGESGLTLALDAARDALNAADMAAEDVDLLIACSFPGESLVINDAAYLAEHLELRGAAFNVESTCAGTLVALQTAASLVQSGAYRNALVVVSADNSRFTDESDSRFWFLADGAGAFIIAPTSPGIGLLGTKLVHTAETCHSLFFAQDTNPNGEPNIRLRAGPGSGKALRDHTIPVLRRCCLGAVEAAGIRLSDIDFFVFNTPAAWFHTFAARVLDVDPAKTLTTFPLYANIGCALTTANLYHAARDNLIRNGSLVLVFAIGSVGSAGAAVMRWGDVFLGPPPAPPSCMAIHSQTEPLKARALEKA
jgi:3-oxoacyl-[acyl-carrier-protein] synthase-3